MTTRWVLFCGTKSMAPWTVQKSPDPSAATVSRVVPGAGPEFLVAKRHVPGSEMPANGLPSASVNTPGSMVT